MKQWIKALFLGMLLFSTTAAQAVPLADLLDGGSITAGDKLFDSWQLLFYDSSEVGRTLDAGNIDVEALTTGNFGLRFSVTNDELSINGDGNYAYLDLMFGFRVSVLDPAWRIKDATLALMDGALTWNPDGTTDVGMYIQEKIGSAPEQDNRGQLAVEFSQLDDAQFADLEAVLDVSALSEIWVTKNILVWAADQGDRANLLGIDQSFSQTQTVVPEPGTVTLMLLGVAGLVTARKKKWL